jgi:tRNA-specific 2-thiouridylase
VGQRRGLGIAAGEPLFVVRLDAENARVVVGPREALATRRITLRNLNWIAGRPFEQAVAEGFPVFARVRSTRPPSPAFLSLEGGEATVNLAEADIGVAPGQACVLYDGNHDEARVLGGGTISVAGVVGQARAA